MKGEKVYETEEWKKEELKRQMKREKVKEARKVECWDREKDIGRDRVVKERGM